jgi:hypothetical protein
MSATLVNTSRTAESGCPSILFGRFITDRCLSQEDTSMRVAPLRARNSTDRRHRRSTFNSAASRPHFEIALVLVRLDHIASRIVNADHSIM